MYQVEAAWGDQRLSVSIVLPRWSHWLGRMGTRHGSWRDTNVTKAHRKRSSTRSRFESVPGRYQPGEDGKEECSGGDEEAGHRRQEWRARVYPIEEASGGGAEDAAPRASGAFMQPGATWVLGMVGLSGHCALPAGHDLQRHIGPGRRPAAAQRRDDHEVVEARRQGARQSEGVGQDPRVVGRDRGAHS
jgi:hypothetical protein